MEFPWIRLKRLIGKTPAIPHDTQEGQLRYVRLEGETDGQFYVARMLSSVLEWYDLLAALAGTAPKTAKYITQTADSTLTAEQSLGALTTGILKNTVTAGTGVLSTAVGADLPSHTHAESDTTSLVTDLGLKANKSDNLSVFAATTSAQLKGVISDETGSGALVFASSPALTTPTGIVKGDVGLGNVDNTSDATKNAAAVTLTNKTITAPIIATISNTGTLTLPTSTDTLVGRATTDTLSNKTIAAPVVTGVNEFQGTIKATGTDPTIANTPVGTYPGAGTTPGSVTVTGSDLAMDVSFTTGTVPAPGAIFKATFAAAKGGTSYMVIIQERLSGGSGTQPYLSARTTNDFTIAVAVAPLGSTVVAYSCLVIDL